MSSSQKKKQGRNIQRNVWPSSVTTIQPRQVAKVGRNDPCPCGAGKKYKDCHEKEGEIFLQKLAREEAKTRLREVRQHLKEQGVPWYKRLFVRL
jgi:hypothetical protein